MIVSGQTRADELWEQSGRKLSKESSDRATSPRAALGRQFAGAGESKLCQENVVANSLKLLSCTKQSEIYRDTEIF